MYITKKRLQIVHTSTEMRQDYEDSDVRIMRTDDHMAETLLHNLPFTIQFPRYVEIENHEMRIAIGLLDKHIFLHTMRPKVTLYIY